MKSLDKVISRVVPAAPATGQIVSEQKSGLAAPGRPRSEKEAARNNRDHVDAINQIFAEFQLAYHNQFHKAYAEPGSLELAKKYWLSCLGEFPPEVILRAAREVVKSQTYLPTLATLTAACEDALPLFGLPAPQVAYTEACCAPEPKTQQQWSHPAVYLAGKLTGWFALASEPQASIFPLFAYHYHLLCQRVVRGERLDIDVPVALPESVQNPLSPAENKARMKALREKFGL